MIHRRITRKRRVLAVAAMSALGLGALSVTASASAAGAPLTETTSQPSTGPSVLGGAHVKSGAPVKTRAYVWAGYVATGGGKPFTYVAATFKVAAVNCHVTPHPSTTSQ